MWGAGILCCSLPGLGWIPRRRERVSSPIPGRAGSRACGNGSSLRPCVAGGFSSWAFDISSRGCGSAQAGIARTLTFPARVGPGLRTGREHFCLSALGSLLPKIFVDFPPCGIEICAKASSPPGAHEVPRPHSQMALGRVRLALRQPAPLGRLAKIGQRHPRGAQNMSIFSQDFCCLSRTSHPRCARHERH